MKRSRTRAWAGVAAAAVATVLPLLTPQVASAAGTLQGAADIRTAGGGAALTSGNSDTDFTLRLPAGAACPGDSGNDGYRVQSYMVPASVNPASLTFDASGPVPNAVGASFRQPLYDTNSNAYVDAQTANAPTPPGPGPIINIPNFDFAVFSPGNIPAGAYNIGIACTLGPAGPSQLTYFWNTKMTFTANAGGGGTAGVTWQFGAVAEQPAVALAPAQQSLQATITPGPSVPADTSYALTATTSTPGAVGGSSTGPSTSQTISGLTAGATYSVTAVANNGVGPSPASAAATATVPNLPGVTGLTFANDGPGETTGVLSWTAPTGPAPTGYTFNVTPAGPTVNYTSGTSATVTGATVGTAYSFTVTPQHAAAVGVANSASTSGSFESSEILIQEITVERPTGKLVLTQRCGVWGDLPVWPASLQAPAAAAVTGTVDTVGTAPFLGPNGTGGQDTANFGEYPYPTDAAGVPNPEYPTYCGINLDKAQFLTSGPGAGQFFFATGQINQVTVVDTRDLDEGWNIVGDVSDFVNVTNPTKTFSGSQLGWDPQNNGVTAPYTDSTGFTYTQSVQPGGIVDPNTSVATGLSSGGATLGRSTNITSNVDGAGGLGISKWDARLKLLIPNFVDAGTYRATLSLTVA